MVALLHNAMTHAQAPMRRRTRYLERRRQRQQRRHRLTRRLESHRAALLLHDPLQRPRRRGIRLAGLALLVLVASVLAHAGILILFAGAGWLVGGDAGAAPKSEKLQMAILEPPPPPPLEEPAAPEVARPEPAPPRAKPKPKPPEPAKPEPPPDPIAARESPAADVPKAPVRRIVGLSLESTVSSGAGPAFSVGNTRMGRTDSRAADPQEVDALPPASSAPVANRVARRLPTAPAKLVAPKRLARVTPTYPEELKVDGVEADVVLAVTVGGDGVVARVEVLKGARDVRFDAAAVAAARAERYQPATRDGVPIEETITFTVRFRLTDI